MSQHPLTVLIRIREHGRRTTIFANAVAAAPLHGAGDRAISELMFSQDALASLLMHSTSCVRAGIAGMDR